MKTTIEFRLAVHEVMVEMALDCTFPSDMNELCIDTVFQKANEKLDKDVDYQRKLVKHKLAEFLNVDSDLEEQFQIWEKLTADNDKDLAEEHLDMWSSIDGSMTIKQLAEQL